MRKAVCLNRACQPPAPIQSNLLAGLMRWRWRKEAAILHLPSLSKKAPKSAYSLLLHVVSSGLNWLFIQPTTLVVNGLSVKFIHLQPIWLTFGLCHEGLYLAAAAVRTDICPRECSKKRKGESPKGMGAAEHLSVDEGRDTSLSQKGCWMSNSIACSSSQRRISGASGGGQDSYPTEGQTSGLNSAHSGALRTTLQLDHTFQSHNPLCLILLYNSSEYTPIRLHTVIIILTCFCV